MNTLGYVQTLRGKMNTHIDIMHTTLLDLENSLENLGRLSEVELQIDRSLRQVMEEIHIAISELDKLYSLDVGHFYT